MPSDSPTESTAPTSSPTTLPPTAAPTDSTIIITGIILIVIVWANGNRGVYTSENHWGVEACAIYWHFVDVVWVFFYPALYLMGTAIHLTH